jgi:hypothetical protein
VNLTKKILIIAMFLTVISASAEKFYIKQMLIADADGDGKNDTTFQESFIGEEFIVLIDELTRSYIDDKSYAFYNMSDSSYFSKTIKELDELASYSDSQLKDFELKNSGEKKKIGSWNAEKYDATAKIMGMDMELEMFIAKDTGFPADIMIRQQDKMHQNAKNIKSMMDKIKATGGIVVREVAKIGGVVVSEKQITEMKKIDKIDKKITDRPKGFKVIQQ